VKKFSFVTLLFVLLFIQTCKKDENPVKPPDEIPESAAHTYSTQNGGTFGTSSGFEITVIPGTVPKNQNGEIANITFSIETPVQIPKPLPTGATLIGDVSKFGPDGFSFNWPVRIKLKYPDSANPENLSILFYNPLIDQWVAIPGSGADSENHYMTADVLQLGFYALVTLSQTGKSKLESAWGGFEFTNPDNTNFYTLTVASVSNWKFSWQEQWFGNSIVGRTGSCGTDGFGHPNPTTRILIPQASYQIWVTYTSGTDYKFYTYSLPLSGTIDGQVTYPGIPPGGVGWTPLGSLPSGGEWVEGLPTSWPTPTVTYGTGAFQATLTWANNEQHATDLDLHLYGPNEMHVYFAIPQASDGSFSLDRDWLTGYGNATENIYSTGTIPSGNYRVTVKHFSGDPANYSVRILSKGAVKSFSGSITDDEEKEIMTFTM